MVAGPDGRKMSKSYGNIVSPDTILVKEGADALRQWALMAGLGDDYPFAQKEIVHAEKFQKKLWNASFFANKFLEGKPTKPKKLRFADKWLLHRLNSVIKKVTELLDRYEFAKALNTIRDFYWHEFCDNYLEMAKHRLYNTKGDEAESAKYVLWRVMHDTTLMLAPFIPHITEELHDQYLKKHTSSKSIHLLQWPSVNETELDSSLDDEGKRVLAIIAAVRKFKTENQLAQNTELSKLVIYDASPVIAAKKDLEEVMKITKVEFSKGSGHLPVLDFSVDVEK